MRTILIGHRGEPSSYPENSLAGFEAVLQAGAAYIETDVQLSADGIPVLCHDPDVVRMTGHDDVVMQTDYATLSRLPAGYPARFGTRFADARISRLGELASLLKRWPRARALVEVKQDSIETFGVARVMDAILAELREVFAQCIIISFQQDPTDSYPRRKRPGDRLGSAGMVRRQPRGRRAAAAGIPGLQPKTPSTCTGTAMERSMGVGRIHGQYGGRSAGAAQTRHRPAGDRCHSRTAARCETRRSGA